MVPRAYSYASAPSHLSKQQERGGAPDPIGQAGTRGIGSSADGKNKTTPKAPNMSTILPVAPTKPVIIPTRTRSDRRSSSTRSKAQRSAGGPLVPHDSHAVPASVAAFLAITSLADTRRKALPRPHLEDFQNYDGQELEEATEYESNGFASSSASSPHSWRLLLSPPQDICENEGPELDGHRTMLGSSSPLRSLSNESMPSLDTDTDSVYTSSNPSTPGLPARGPNLRERRTKSISSSVPEDCISSHPLLVICSEHEQKSGSALEDLKTSGMQPPAPARPSFRSNLTISLRRLKSAARTISNLTAPAPYRDDDPSPVSLSAMSKVVPERRPLPWAEPPDPALRRYLNPIVISPAELYTHRDREEGGQRPTASIQMQTYWPGAKKSEKASMPPVFVHAASEDSSRDEPAVSTTSRQREPRENSDFLRVIVLEMNMRKVGKLSDVAPGRAKLWLPARQASTQMGDVGNETPKRWISVSS
ncbi:MAG: hypothetical protein Q9170_002500 [Blastenia crenularia]